MPLMLVIKYIQRRNNMDTFFEQLIKRRKDTKDYVLIAVYAIAAVIALFILTTLYAIPLVSMFAIPLQALVIFFAYRLISSRNIEFEYAVTNGDLEIDKILNRQKRSKLVSIESKSVEIMVPLGDSRIPAVDEKDIIDATTGNPDADIYCIVFGETGRKILLFEPTKRIADELKKRNPRNVFLKD